MMRSLTRSCRLVSAGIIHLVAVDPSRMTSIMRGISDAGNPILGGPEANEARCCTEYFVPSKPDPGMKVVYRSPQNNPIEGLTFAVCIPRRGSQAQRMADACDAAEDLALFGPKGMAYERFGAAFDKAASTFRSQRFLPELAVAHFLDVFKPKWESIFQPACLCRALQPAHKDSIANFVIQRAEMAVRAAVTRGLPFNHLDGIIDLNPYIEAMVHVHMRMHNATTASSSGKRHVGPGQGQQGGGPGKRHSGGRGQGGRGTGPNGAQHPHGRGGQRGDGTPGVDNLAHDHS